MTFKRKDNIYLENVCITVDKGRFINKKLLHHIKSAGTQKFCPGLPDKTFVSKSNQAVLST